MPQREIDNPYAYRDCERWLHQHYGKKPSPPPSTGSATTPPRPLHAAAPRDLQLVPKRARAAGRAVLEVYPALAKMGQSSAVRPELQPHPPAILIPGADPFMMPRSAP